MPLEQEKEEYKAILQKHGLLPKQKFKKYCFKHF